MDKYYKLLFSKEIKGDISDLLKGKEVIIVGPAPYLEGSQLGELIDSYDVVIRLKSGYPIPSELQQDLGNRIDLWYTNLKAEHNHLNSHTLDKMVKHKLKTIVFPYPIKYQQNDVFKSSVLNLIKIFRNNFRTGIGTIQQHFNSRKKICPFKISYDLSSNYFQILEKIIGCRPTTGVLAIMDILQYDVKKLQLVGFSFRHEILMDQEKYIQKPSTFTNNDTPVNLFDLYSSYYKTDESVIRSWNKTIINRTHDIRKELIFIKELRKLDTRLKVDSYLYDILTKMDEDIKN